MGFYSLSKSIQSLSSLINKSRYSLPYQIHTADIYPVSAPNGSKIIVCGHENGLLVIWRGGRPFKISREPSQLNKSHEMIIDTNEEEEDDAAKPAEFEEQEPDEVGSFLPIIQKLEIPFGTAVTHIAFPRLPQISKPQMHPLAPGLLQQKLVVALACADNSVRLLTLPLTPPSPAQVSSKKIRDNILSTAIGYGTWGEELVTLPNAYQSLPRGVALAFAPRELTRDDADSEDEKEGFDVLVASHAADIAGVLSVHRIPVKSKGHGIDTRPGKTVLWRSKLLSSPACSIDILVSSQTTPKVLIAESRGAVRIFECVTGQLSDPGKWAFSLFAHSMRIAEGHTDSILCARWVMNGHAIIVLTVEGEWGIWNISASGSKGISGASPTPFTISGRVGTVATSTAPKSSNERPEVRSQLAPMTPSTRKIRQEALFLGKTDAVSKRGGISIKITSGSITAGEGDESLVIWHGDNVINLPSLRTHWQNKFKGPGSVFTTSANGHVREITPVSLHGELRVAVSAFPTDESSSISSSKQLDVLVVGERSLVILAASLAPKDTYSKGLTPPQRQTSDKSYLSQGLLDIDSIDRMLDHMEGSALRQGSPTPKDKKRVAFNDY
jgi:hypothetical protein